MSSACLVALHFDTDQAPPPTTTAVRPCTFYTDGLDSRCKKDYNCEFLHSQAISARNRASMQRKAALTARQVAGDNPRPARPPVPPNSERRGQLLKYNFGTGSGTASSDRRRTSKGLTVRGKTSSFACATGKAVFFLIRVPTSR
eukprot:m.337736 g.337736  ORF g.337736 m.337736 type:complete len:144 (+) comp27796_c0_seq21:1288-1719(+)